MRILLSRRQFLGQTAALALVSVVQPTEAAESPVKELVTGQPQAVAAGQDVIAACGNAIDRCNARKQTGIGVGSDGRKADREHAVRRVG
jgi:hypothetical protein